MVGCFLDADEKEYEKLSASCLRAKPHVASGKATNNEMVPVLVLVLVQIVEGSGFASYRNERQTPVVQPSQSRKRMKCRVPLFENARDLGRKREGKGEEQEKERENL